MKFAPCRYRKSRSALMAAAALLALSFGSGALAQQGGGRPAAAGSPRPTSAMPARMPSRLPAAPPSRPAAPAASDNAASATTTMEHTDGGIIRTTTVTNQQGTMTGSTSVNRDDDAGTKTVTTTNTGFDGETRGVENTVTRTEDGVDHAQTKTGDDDEDEGVATSDQTSPPES